MPVSVAARDGSVRIVAQAVTPSIPPPAHTLAVLAPLAEAHGASLLTKLLPQPNTTCFQALAKSIVYQQLAGSAACE